VILHIDHLGIVAHSLAEASDLLLDRFGFTVDVSRSPLPRGLYMAPENATIYFLKVGTGQTQIELLLPRDTITGMGKWLARRGPSVHHIAYMVDDVATQAAELRSRGLQEIDLGPNPSAAFFYPKTTMGILTELVDAKTMTRLHAMEA
jgi:methylmalonyl-CoA/ethylmalonyl-CoA epimerase